MKTVLALLTLIAATAVGHSSFAQDRVYRERVILDETNEVSLDLNDKTVRCSSIGYGQPELKVSVPDLAYLAVFNHVNFGETLPCMTAGRCAPGNLPGDILRDDSPNEAVKIHVVRVETILQSYIKKTCTRKVEERVEATIRGKTFKHVRRVDLGEGALETCDNL